MFLIRERERELFMFALVKHVVEDEIRIPKTDCRPSSSREVMATCERTYVSLLVSHICI